MNATTQRAQRSRAVAAAILCLSALVIWRPVLGGGVVWALPLAALAIAEILGVLPVPSRRAGWVLLGFWVVWTPIAMAACGLPLWMLAPQELPGTFSQLVRALAEGLRDGGGAGNTLFLPAWLAFTGAAWLYGAKQTSRSSSFTMALSFVLLAFPFALELALQRSDDRAWHGAVVLAAALLWATKGGLRAALPGIAVVSLIAVIMAVAVGPRDRWDSVGGGQLPPFTALDSKQTYGPQKNEQTGRPMFDITAPRPARWRMQVLDTFDGRGWVINPSRAAPLPQPAAVATTTRVRVRGLRDSRVAAPGRVSSVRSASSSQRALVGDAVELSPTLSSGDVYASISEEVLPKAGQLGDPVPAGSPYPRYTQLWMQPYPDQPMPYASIADAMPPELVGTSFGEVVAMARRLSVGAKTQLEVVQRVVAELKTSGHYRYSLNVEDPGQAPLIDFLVNTHVGYCQHFAGAAALLLRMAGIPTRVVIGFATGTDAGNNTYEVRDKDGHAWIEVYFPSAGWVPFDPTTAGTEATIPESIETSVVPPSKGSGAGARAALGPQAVRILTGVLAAIALAGAAFWLLRRRRHAGPPRPLGEVLVPLVPGPPGIALTLSELRALLMELGPTVAALADDAERQRFGPRQEPPEPHPRRRVWRALRKDVGVLRAAKLITIGAGRRPVTWTPVAVAPEQASVAPPPAGGTT